jgi:hypothetical protein
VPGKLIELIYKGGKIIAKNKRVKKFTDSFWNNTKKQNEIIKKNKIARQEFERKTKESLKTKSPKSMMDDSKKMFDAVLQGIPKAERERARRRLLIKTKTKRIELEAKKSAAQRLKDKFKKDK